MKYKSKHDTPIRKHAAWMAQPDERVLEFLHSHGPHRAEELRSGLSEVSNDLVYPRTYLYKRCELLAEYGLLQYDRQTLKYDLTDRAAAYLDGRFDASALGPSEPGRIRSYER